MVYKTQLEWVGLKYPKEFCLGVWFVELLATIFNTIPLPYVHRIKDSYYQIAPEVIL